MNQQLVGFKKNELKMAGFIENLDFVTICKIVQTWCSRNNTVNVAYVPCYCRQNSDDWI